MARIIPWPAGMGIRALQALTGPASIGAGSSTSVGGFMQTLASPYGGWAYQFSIPPCQSEGARRLRGWLAAMQMGANATLVPWRDADIMEPEEAGLSLDGIDPSRGVPWANGEPWANLMNWQPDYPKQLAGVAAAKGETIVSLTGAFWALRLGLGDVFGFSNQFAKYMVTEVISAGVYRIWPPLRAPIYPVTKATLYPVVAMRMDAGNPASYTRNEAYVEETTVTLYEVYHDDVVVYFSD